MATSFTAVPPDSTGDKLGMTTLPVGADTLHMQWTHSKGLPTYRVIVDAAALAANKYHLYLRNDTGSNQTLWMTGLYLVNVGTATVTGVATRFDCRRVTGVPTMTPLTPFGLNSADPALSGVTAGHTVTAGLTDGQLIKPIMLSSDEQTAAATNIQQLVDTINHAVLAHPWQRPLAARPGEAFALKQITAVTAGTLCVYADFVVEPD